MMILQGTPISPGYASGLAVVHGTSRDLPVPSRSVAPAEVPAELRRFDEALERATRELSHVRDRILADFGQAQAGIIAVHLALLHDRHFIQKVKVRVSRDGVNVEQAIVAELDAAAAHLQAAKDEYFQERAQDIRDVGQRLLRQLVPTGGGLLMQLPPNCILVAHELYPSETLDLDRAHVAALITERGGPTSHAAILAKSLGVPALTGVAGATTRIDPGALVLVDAQNGRIVVNPTTEQHSAFIEAQKQYADAAAEAAALEQEECITLEGERVCLFANIARPREAAEAVRHHLVGVGLFRTEFMFMEGSEPPTFDRQVRAYREAIELLQGRPLVIRTMDLGGDKVPGYLAAHRDAAGGLTSRGLHFALTDGRAMFETQLRAIMVATAGENVRILFPMVLGGDDLRKAIELLRSVSGDGRIPPIGAMIETPAALFSLDRILDHADFISIGTNDLTHSMLVLDRHMVDSFEGNPILHPSVLRAIAHITETAMARRKVVSVCGEAAGDAPIASLLVGMGVRELSMSPPRAGRVKLALRQVRLEEARRLAGAALAADDINEVRQRLAALFKNL